MAIAKEIWSKAKFLFEIGKTLQEIENETGIKRSSISKKAKEKGWIKSKNQQLKSDIVGYEEEKSTLDEKKSTLVEKVSQLSDFEITIIQDVVENETHHKSMFFNNMNLAMIRSNQQLSKNKKVIPIKTRQGYGKGSFSEDIEDHEIELDPSDIKNHVELNHKIAVSMGVIEEKPKVAIQNNNNNSQNVEIEGYSVETIEDQG